MLGLQNCIPSVAGKGGGASESNPCKKGVRHPVMIGAVKGAAASGRPDSNKGKGFAPFPSVIEEAAPHLYVISFESEDSIF